MSMAGWRDQAACLGRDAELWFPIGNTSPYLDQIAQAKAACAHCDVRSECLEYALDTGQHDGVWGGQTEGERRALRRKR